MSELDKGTLSATGGGTEDTLKDVTAAVGIGTFSCWVDLFNMAVGDTVTLKVYKKTIATGGTYRLVDEWTFSNTQAKPLFTFLPIDSRYGVKFTLTKVNAGSMNFDWQIEKLS